jgi:hypothetical protein
MTLPTLAEWGLERLSGIDSYGWSPGSGIAAVSAARRGSTVVALQLYGKLDKRAMEGVLALHELEYLDLGQAGVTNKWLAKLGALPMLRSLDLWYTSFGDVGAEGLAESRSLEFLDVRKTKIGDAGLAALARIPSLRQLSVTAGASIPEGGIAALAATAQGLEALAIVRPAFTYQSSWIQQSTLDAIAARPSLRALSLYGVVGDLRLDPLARLPHLEALNLGGNWHRTGRSWMEGVASLRSVESLDLTNCYFEGIGDLAHLAGLERLREVGIYGAELSDPERGSLRIPQVTRVMTTNPHWTATFPAAEIVDRYSANCLLGVEGQLRPLVGLTGPPLVQVVAG